MRTREKSQVPVLTSPKSSASRLGVSVAATIRPRLEHEQRRADQGHAPRARATGIARTQSEDGRDQRPRPQERNVGK